ncbi:hypothetical protein K435DRAFT_851814 [Dendrothele bispora CBS 962.96]|uniref:Uncharacterized protein n=1 Tax=Dendrothele bispora (strain CBS 962.96) TaxID=1314807 RepID=A0A4S8ML06_DENBC|nr:hypothetical protein K435DRAFT_851814 [Dendrothele bispora CBS 962.96]
MAIVRAIISNVEYHSHLVQVSGSLEWVPKALTEQVIYIEDLQRQVKRMKEVVEDMEETTREKKEMRTSMVKRVAGRVVGKKEVLMARVDKEERQVQIVHLSILLSRVFSTCREYEKALQHETQERARQRLLEDMIEEATRVRCELEAKTELRFFVQRSLSTLYSNVFSLASAKSRAGEFPQNDQVEILLRAAKDNYASLQGQINANEAVLKLLEEADDSIIVTLKYLEACLTQYALWGVRRNGDTGVLSEIGRDLRSAAKAALRAELSFDGARIAEPMIQPLPPLVVYRPTTPVASTTIGGNDKFSSATALATIKKNKNDIATAQKTVKFEIRSMGSRIRLLQVDLSKAENVIQETEEELTKVRREIWDEIVQIRSSSSSDCRGAVVSGRECSSLEVNLSECTLEVPGLGAEIKDKKKEAKLGCLGSEVLPPPPYEPSTAMKTSFDH